MLAVSVVKPMMFQHSKSCLLFSEFEFFFLARLLVALVKVRHGELADHGHLDHPALGLVACWREPPATSLVAVLLLLLLLLLILEAKLTIIVLE